MNLLISNQRKRRDLPDSVVLILIFQNMFNAFSPYITIAFNILIAIIILMATDGRLDKRNPVVLYAAYLALIWLLIISVLQGGDIDFYTLFKYTRVALFVTIFTIILAASSIATHSIIKALNFSFAFHVLLIFMQIIFPDLSYLTAPFFGFNRETTILELYTLRKLGASSSYDTASLFSILAFMFFYLQYEKKNTYSYLTFTILSFVASLMSSRTGIALSVLIMFLIFLRLILTGRLQQKIVALLALVAMITSGYNYLYPLILHSIGETGLSSNDVISFYSTSDYGTTGSWIALTTDHLKPLNQPILDLIIGRGVDPNSIGKPTDIGYVKLIYHIGIIGALVILSAHIYMIVAIRKMIARFRSDIDILLISYFLFYFIIITLIFNYKSQEIHSRGSGDIIYFLFLYLLYQINRIKFTSNNKG